ncbi:MAG: glycosyltransferase family 2 protein [Flavobacteriales bacterium]|nr:glycosyltransferase family 2 protein [Flavobacteriales bacterium]
MDKPLIQILLSTYNGSRFLREQLDSIVNQSYRNWQLLIRDDGSSDGTEAIIEEYCTKHANRIKFVSGGKGGDASSSFISMLHFVDSPYIMFCDQDDVWVTEKVQNAFNAIQSLEKQNPLALHYTDMKIVNENMTELYPSFFEQQKLNPEWSATPYHSFTQSIAAGCTMIFTKALIHRLHPIKAPLFQHDHWLTMHASYYGVIGYSLEKTVYYRQHQSNVVGSHEINKSYFFSKISSLMEIWQRWKYIRTHFGNEISILKLIQSKWKLNKQRV